MIYLFSWVYVIIDRKSLATLYTLPYNLLNKLVHLLWPYWTVRTCNDIFFGVAYKKHSPFEIFVLNCMNEFFDYRFEDGTLPYLSIVSLMAGFETIEQLIPGHSMHRISRHCFNLAKYLYDSLKALKYSNGRNVIYFYHDTAFESISYQSGIVSFNILHEDGSFVGFSEV